MDPLLVNPAGRVLAEIEERLRPARKSKSVWARQLEVPMTVETLEGDVRAAAGDYLCRGVLGEQWPQRAESLLKKYEPSGVVDRDGWQRFDPRPDAARVEAVAIERPFIAETSWGLFRGQAGDYLVRQVDDRDDVWIVSKSAFESTYEFEGPDDHC